MVIRTLLTTALIVCCGACACAGSLVSQEGITVDASLVLEGFNNFVGGLSTAHPVGASTFDLNLTLDTERLSGWRGGKFYIQLEDHAGQNPTTALVGDLQIFDKLNAAPYFQIFELWYQQKLLADRLRLKIGKVDANTEFSVITNGLPFLNSSTQVSPTVLGFPTTPVPMPSVNLFLTPNTSYYAGFGAYDANRSVTFGNFVGSPQDVLPTDNGGFFIGETGVKWPRTSASAAGGNLKLGFWGHTGTFTRLDGSQRQGAHGYYAIIDQTIWQPAGGPENGRGWRTFLVYGRTQKSVSTIDWSIGGGVTWTGPSAARPNDVIGFGPQYAHISPQTGLPQPYELALEALYRTTIAHGVEIMPDLQYIIHPGGQYPNALVGTLHVAVEF